VLGRRSSSRNADFVDVVAASNNLGIRAEYVDWLSTPEEAQLVESLRPDILLVLGWSALVSASIRRIAGTTVGSHPAPLPVGRGRNTISWAIALGLRETALTLFELTDEADAGPILWQGHVPITDTDDAATIYGSIERLARVAVPEVVRQLIAGRATRTPQDATKAVVWRKRTDADRVIDWRTSSRSIDRLVRAITHPYVGAWAIVDGRPHSVWRAAPRALIPEWSGIEPGRVLAVEGRIVTVRSADGAVDLVDHELPELAAGSEL
jgi:methionyl-tRNA formyltransferase